MSALKEFISFFKYPSEKIDKKKTFSEFLIFIACCVALYVISLAVPIIKSIFVKELPSFISSDLRQNAIPLWFVLIVPVVLEETAFRLALVRNKPYVFVSISVLLFILISILSAGHVYVAKHLVFRIIAAVALSIIIAHFGIRWIQKIKYGEYFYISALLFGLYHLINYNFTGISIIEVIFIILTVFLNSMFGVLCGFSRIRYGFIFSVMLHLINNGSIIFLSY